MIPFLKRASRAAAMIFRDVAVVTGGKEPPETFDLDGSAPIGTVYIQTTDNGELWQKKATGWEKAVFEG